jgi:CheY-like chemotaxis protein
MNANGAADPRKGGGGQMVLVVEDEPMQRMMMSELLYDAGFWSVEAGDAHQALHLLEARKDIKIVFVDINLPFGLDGLELARIVRRQWPDIAIVLTSGLMDAPFDDLPDGAVFFQKPFRSQDVVPVLHSMVH